MCREGMGIPLPWDCCLVVKKLLQWPLFPQGKQATSPAGWARNCVTTRDVYHGFSYPETQKKLLWGEPFQPRVNWSSSSISSLSELGLGHWQGISELSTIRWKGNIFNLFPRIKEKTHQNKSVLWLCSCQPNLGGAEWDLSRDHEIAIFEGYFWPHSSLIIPTKLPVLEVAEHLAWGSEQSAWPSTAQHKQLL